MKETKMGVFQAASIIITVMISHIILNMPNHLITSTGSSTILNLVYIFIIVMLVFFLAYKVFKLFPGKDLVDISEYAGGKFLKNVFSIIICIYFTTISAFVIRTFAESLVLIYFPNVDREIVVLVFVTIAVVMNLFGFKAISRVTLITIPIILISMILIFVSSASNFIPQRALPILGYGVYDTFVSGLTNIFAFSSTIIIPFLIPYIGSGKELKKSSIISVIVYSIYLILGVIALLFLIPSITEINNTLSIYILSRRANFGQFVQRIDAIFILIWIMSIFNYLAITMHFTLATFKRMTNIRYERAMVFCFAAFLFTIALIPRTTSDINTFERSFYKYISISIVFVFTGIMLIFAYFKKKKRLKKGARL